MTITVRAKIRKMPPTMPGDPLWYVMIHPTPWFVDYGPIPWRSVWAHSHPEAMQAAYKGIADLEEQLMDEVHASRASRRQETRA